MTAKAIYPGSFDPLTKGHMTLIAEAAKLCDELIVAVAINTTKTSLFSLEDRLLMLHLVYADMPNISIASFSGLTVDFARANGASILVRGLRLSADFEYEFQLAGMNHDLDAEVQTIFLPSIGGYSHVSSSMVREVIRLGGDISKFVPKEVISVITKSAMK
jgi:pantetheine-phosphate adenylyltransferase